MAKAEQQSSEQGVQGRFSYGRFRAVASFMHKNLKKKNIPSIPGSSIHCSAKNKLIMLLKTIGNNRHRTPILQPEVKERP